MKKSDATLGLCHYKPEYWGTSMSNFIYCQCIFWFESDSIEKDILLSRHKNVEEKTVNPKIRPEAGYELHYNVL